MRLIAVDQCGYNVATPWQVFPCEFFEAFEITFFIEYPWTNASELLKDNINNTRMTSFPCSIFCCLLW